MKTRIPTTGYTNEDVPLPFAEGAEVGRLLGVAYIHGNVRALAVLHPEWGRLRFPCRHLIDGNNEPVEVEPSEI